VILLPLQYKAFISFISIQIPFIVISLKILHINTLYPDLLLIFEKFLKFKN